MSRSKDINPFTLYPKDPEYRVLLVERLKKKVQYILVISAIFAGIAAIFNFIVAIIATKEEGETSKYYLLPIVDASRTMYYLLAILAGRMFPLLGYIGAWSVPLLFSVTVTEAFIIVGSPLNVYARYRYF